jgi:hypothetical protein
MRRKICVSRIKNYYSSSEMKMAPMKYNTPMYICFALILVTGTFMECFAQAPTTPIPTQLSGTNRITRSSDGRSFIFSFNGIPLYQYNTMTNGSYKGSFVGLSVLSSGIANFFPAMCGGVLAVDHERIVYPCEENISFTLDDQFISEDSIALLWSMYLNYTKLYDYWMSFQLKDKTLVIDIEGASDNRNGAGITLAEAFDDRKDLAIVPVPYFTLSSLLYRKSTRTFVSMFFDWERTHCSRMLPLSAQKDHVLFASVAEYFPKTDGIRNKVKERIYLTVSQDIDEVMPNIVGPTAPLKSTLQDKIIISYHQPFPWILEPLVPNTSLPSYLDSLKNLGITNVALLIKDWWWSGFDRGNPKILPANDFNMQRDGWDCNNSERTGGGGDDVLLKVRDKAHAFGYLFGLHQNYVDMYSTSRPGAAPNIQVDDSLLSRLPGVQRQRAWAYPNNCRHENSWAIKPSRVFAIASLVSSALYEAYQSDWNYLDVTSALNPSGPLPIEGHGSVYSPVDFEVGTDESSRDSAGMFLHTLQKYRAVPQAVRNSTHNSPVQGEGGNHFLYAGYFDDFEARIKTALLNISGYFAPMFVDFHLNKLRSKSSYHGAGHIYEFYNRGWDTFFTDKEILTFIATELAYGNGGLVTKSANNCMDNLRCDHSLKQIALEYKHVFPMQQLLVKANVISISYYDSTGVVKTASQYIADHPNEFADINSSYFLGRVRVEYSNGVVVYVNRNREAGSWIIRELPSSRKYNYNVLLGGKITQGAGVKPSEPVVLPVECGWVWYSPL